MMQEHNKIQLYVGLEEGGCVDVGAIKLAGFTLIETNALQYLKEERDALAAQVEALRVSLAALSVQSESVLQEDIFCYSALKRAQREADEVLDKTPQQHLAEIRAEAGRDGFFKGVAWILDIDVKDISAMVAEEAAKQYADSIRKGVR